MEQERRGPSRLTETMLKDCGSLVFTDDWLRELIAKNDPKSKNGPHKGAWAYVESITYLPFARREHETKRETVERSVVTDVQFLRNHPLIKPSIPITGWIIRFAC